MFQTPPPTAAAAHVHSSRCLSPEELGKRTDKFQRRYWVKVGAPESPPQDARSCSKALEEMHGDVSARSLAPWRYRMNRDVDRFPPDIAFAECLCQGCIIDQREDLSYNSLPVMVQLMVLSRSLCPSDPDKYVITKDSIHVPVACTCVVPRS
ncbi:interleukin-17C-like [Hippoglossus stenolepis]|uniref:interleukin-17C-like n=1 Tax=Hippoglossus stenolepis TaxID=195615 RepID=UPI001FAFB6DD|nr:interleukin-17C-like [Hippoglossus stenolepis]